MLARRVVSLVILGWTEVLSCALSPTCCLQFSSFDPDVCAMLRARQQRIPVFFLSTGGTVPHPNPDRMGLDAAINFALRSNLQVLITASHCCYKYG